MRLIDADALADTLGEMWRIPKAWDGHMGETCDDAFDAIGNAPTIDAVRVVRCKDCKWRGTAGCVAYGEEVWDMDNDYCSYGEK